MNLINCVGSWASIAGFMLTIITMFLAARVDRKVNSILRVKADKTYFSQKVSGCIESLKGVQGIAADVEKRVLFSTRQYTEIKQAIDLVGSSWDTLYLYENNKVREKRKREWEEKFTYISQMYDHIQVQNRQYVIDFLSELIIFLEKEKEANER